MGFSNVLQLVLVFVGGIIAAAISAAAAIWVGRRQSQAAKAETDVTAQGLIVSGAIQLADGRGEEIERQKKEIDGLRQDLDHAQARIRAQDGEIAQYKEQNVKLQAQLYTLNEENRTLRGRVDDLEGQAKQRNTQIGELWAEVAQLRTILEKTTSPSRKRIRPTNGAIHPDEPAQPAPTTTTTTPRKRPSSKPKEQPAQ